MNLVAVFAGILIIQGLFSAHGLSTSESAWQYLRHFSSTRNVYFNQDLKQTTRHFITLAFKGAGLETWSETFPSNDPQFPGVNIVGRLPGRYAGSRDDRIVLIGAHYDSVRTTPGVNDNGSGMVALLQTLKFLTNSDRQNCSRNYTLIFVAFDLEESQPMGPGCSDQSDYTTCPCGKGDHVITYDCGSYYFVQNFSSHVNASGAQVTGAFILDCLLDFNDTSSSQDLPPGASYVFPDLYQEIANNQFRGDFLALIGRQTDDITIMSTVQKHFDTSGKFKLVAARLPITGRPSDSLSEIQIRGFSSFFESDHFRFWQSNPSMSAIHLSDTSYYRGYFKNCFHKNCDSLDHVTDDMIAFLGNTVDSLVKSAEELTQEKCNIKRRECGGEQTAESGTIQSPYFPAKYPNNVLCEWVLNADRDGLVIDLSFDKFDLESSENCDRDFLKVQEPGNDVFGVYCGSDKPSKIKTNSKTVKIVFQSDQLEAFTGFNLTWSTKPAPKASGNVLCPARFSMFIAPLLVTWLFTFRQNL